MTSAPAVFCTHPSAATAETAHDAAPCSACRHELAAHDAIGHRFCQATQAQALDRSCICRNQN